MPNEFKLLEFLRSCAMHVSLYFVQVSWYWYFLLGFADAQGCYLVIKAYQYSSITSVTLLDCWTVPWVILLTWIVLGTRYSLWQLFGGTLCVLGLSLVLLSDTRDGGDGGGSKIILGDVLVIVGTVFYAISNVGEEFCVKKKDRVEVVAMIGVYGFLVTAVEVYPSYCSNLVFQWKPNTTNLNCFFCLIIWFSFLTSLFDRSVLELKTLESIKWSADIVLAFAGYGVSSFVFYSLAPFVLKLSGSTMFNLSLLTADMWAVVFRVFFYHQKVDWLYFLSFAVVGIGLTIYSTTEKKSVHAAATTIEEDENLNTEYQILNGENESQSIST
ncbi:hypothetical protein KIW84_031354 [Lathyrus oleraceus]|uniref:Uncharacterized protein n=1 Tax=Pisum sativum TaxID=3888 RepID=A0A9D4XUQ7_PEA|nr:hypothetical protein KIW84_031354 [Pisum sativum]